MKKQTFRVSLSPAHSPPKASAPAARARPHPNPSPKGIGAKTGEGTKWNAQQGFSLLEAIVALVLMATCLMALYAWLSGNTLALNRASWHAQALGDARAARAVLETINPMAEPAGVRELPPLSIRWRAQPLSEQRFGISRNGTATQFDFRLYDLHVEVLRDGDVVREFNMRKTGWVAARPISLDDF